MALRGARRSQKKATGRVGAADIEGCLNARGRCQSRVVTELFIPRAVLQPEMAIQETETISDRMATSPRPAARNENVLASGDARTGAQTSSK
jgi:hypothetical protein